MKTYIATTLGAAMMFAAIAPASAGTVGDGYNRWTLYSDSTIACIEADAAAKLTPVQYGYLESIMDNKVNAYATWRDNHLTLADTVKVHTFVWSAGPNCVLKS